MTTYDRYLSTHFGASNRLDESEFRSSAAYYRAVIGPFLPSDRDARILDVASGAGHFLRFLQQANYQNCEGVDVCAELVNYCRATLSTAVTQADAFDFLDEAHGPFDAITIFDLLEHLDADSCVRLLSLARERLNPGGRVIVKTINMACLASTFLRHIDLTHVQGFTERSLSQAFGMAGFGAAQIVGGEADGPPRVRLRQWCNANLHRAIYRLSGRTDIRWFTQLIVGIGDRPMLP